jgi:hypothetical protein
LPSGEAPAVGKITFRNGISMMMVNVSVAANSSVAMKAAAKRPLNGVR